MSSEWADQTAPGAAPGAGAPVTPADAGGVPGRALAAQREALGWSVEQVAEQLKMAVRQVVALEAGDYACLPGPAVVRGFVRAYAKVVKLDPVPLVAMIAIDSESAGDTTPRTVRRDKPASFSEVRFPTNGKRSGLPLGLIGGAIALAAAVAAAWQFGLIPRSLVTSGAAPASPAASAGTAPAAPAPGAVETTLVKPGEEMKPMISPGVPLISVPPVAAASAPVVSPPGSPPASPVVSPAPATAPAAAVPAAPPGALVLNVRQDAWIDLRTTDGKKLFSGLVKGGTVKPFDIKGPVTLKVGNAAAVDATLRGTAVPLAPTSGTVARVNLQ